MQSPSTLPPTSERQRLKEYMRTIQHLPAETQRLMLKEYNYKRHAHLRRLNREAKHREEKLSSLSAARATWSRDHDHNLHALREDKQSRQLMLSNGLLVANYLADHRWREEQINRDRETLAEHQRQQILARIERFNNQQSMLRARTLTNIPDAPMLTNLQAVFLSPRSRRQMGLEDRRKKDQASESLNSPTHSPLSPSANACSEPTNVTPTSRSASTSVLSPRALLARSLSNRPPRHLLEAALRADYDIIDAQRRSEERKELELELVVASKTREVRLRAAFEQRRIEDARETRYQRHQAEKREKRELRDMLNETFGESDDDDGAGDEYENKSEEEADVTSELVARDGDSENRFDEDNLTLPSRHSQDADDTTARIFSPPSRSKPSARLSSPHDDLATLKRYDRLNKVQSRVDEIAAGTDNNLNTAALSSLTSSASALSTSASSLAYRDRLQSDAHIRLKSELALESARQQREAAESVESYKEQRQRQHDWLETHPPLPNPFGTTRRTRLERRNPHEWVLEREVLGKKGEHVRFEDDINNDPITT